MAGENHGSATAAITRRAKAIMDMFVKRLVEAVVKASVEINPTFVLMRGFARDQQNFGAQHSGVTHQIATGFD